MLLVGTTTILMDRRGRVLAAPGTAPCCRGSDCILRIHEISLPVANQSEPRQHGAVSEHDYFFLFSSAITAFASCSNAVVKAATSPPALPGSVFAVAGARKRNEMALIVGSRFGAPAPYPPEDPIMANIRP